ncbi:UBX [Penicillium digitatum]|uniref:UBX domain-containing protein 2 n=1 Tax=Penicillium digitatum TaxID=36651 RepID=A0A7T7BPZ5_PENDI|nr:UBX [Penicillium digitatum]
MTLFYNGSLQEGIAAAVRDAKAVACFVRDDEELSSQWEVTYFGDDGVAQALNAKAVVLRLSAGSQEAGFLASFCPISKFPTVVLIKNGTLKEYIGPDIPKDDFRSRLIAALEDEQKPSPVQQLQSNDTPAAPTNYTPVSVAPQPQPGVPSNASKSTKQTSEITVKKQSSIEQMPVKAAEPAKPAGSMSQKPLSFKAGNKDIKGKAPMGSKKPTDKVVVKNEPQEPKPRVPRGPPNEYRLQVRLFDGSSVRSSFAPTQSIRNDVRAWLDQKMEGDNRPYNLKHILTPLPSENLSVTQESQTLQDLGLGSTANLVMVPVSTYTEAYSAAGSFPVRGFSAIYNLASSAASTATGLVGSFLRYGSTAQASGAITPSASPATGNSQRPRTTGPNIQTLRDQQGGRGNSQLYNGNQLNFEPRKKQDDKDK